MSVTTEVFKGNLSKGVIATTQLMTKLGIHFELVLKLNMLNYLSCLSFYLSFTSNFRLDL